MSILRGHELHLLTGAYAADAVTGAELAEFEKHLEELRGPARKEVRGLRETAARLAVIGHRDRAASLDASRCSPPPAAPGSYPPPARRLLDFGSPARGRWPRRALSRPVALRPRRPWPRPSSCWRFSRSTRGTSFSRPGANRRRRGPGRARCPHQEGQPERRRHRHGRRLAAGRRGRRHHRGHARSRWRQGISAMGYRRRGRSLRRIDVRQQRRIPPPRSSPTT